MKNENPIGLFDSGIGGTSIWKEVHALMPFENTIYLADSKNAPYGLKSKDEIKYEKIIIDVSKLDEKDRELLVSNSSDNFFIIYENEKDKEFNCQISVFSVRNESLRFGVNSFFCLDGFLRQLLLFRTSRFG